MKKLVTMLMVGIMSISMIGCGGKKSDKEVKTDTKANEVSAPKDIANDWYINDDTSLASGVYVVGADIKPGGYYFVENPGQDFDRITLFENMDRYRDYLNSDRSDSMNRGGAIQNNAMDQLFATSEEDIADGEEKKYIDLFEGNVVMVWGGGATLRPDDSDEIKAPKTGKIKKLGNNAYTRKDLKGTFFLTIPKDKWSVNVYIFDNADAYKKYTDKKKETDDSVEIMTYGDKVSYFNESAHENSAFYVNLDKDQILYVDGIVYAQEVEMAWSEK